MLQCWDKTRNARPADFPGKSSSIQVSIHYLPQISSAQRSILAIHSIGGPFKLVSLSLLWNLGVALLLDIYCGNRSRLLCARTPHKIRVRLVRPDLVLLIEVSKVVLYLRCIKCHVNYRDGLKGGSVLLSNSQTGSGRVRQKFLAT